MKFKNISRIYFKNLKTLLSIINFPFNLKRIYYTLTKFSIREISKKGIEITIRCSTDFSEVFCI